MVLVDSWIFCNHDEITIIEPPHVHKRVKPSMEHLNGDVLGVVYEYLSRRDQLKILLVSKDIILSQAKDFRKLHLTPHSSTQYALSDPFRRNCLTLITNTTRQLCLNFRNSTFPILSAPIMEKKCLPYQSSFLSEFMGFDYKEHTSTGAKNDSGARHKDINVLNSECLSRNSLMNVLSMNLSGCQSVTDVSMLGNIPTLNLSHCNNISDVTSLRNVKNLNLCGCLKIKKGVSELGNAHCLNLSGCSWLQNRDIAALAGVHTLSLNYCQDISNVTPLGQVHSLDLRGCVQIEDVSALSLVTNLDISWCWQVSDVSNLGALRTLNLRGCAKVTDISALSNVKHLDVKGCSV